MASVGSEDGDVGFQIAPMVDVVFVLMLFFMASAGMQVIELELGINLPSGASSRAGGPPPVPIIINISEEGLVTLNEKTFDTAMSKEMPALRAWLLDNVESGGEDDPVVIKPAPDTQHHRIIDILSAASAAGVKNLTFS